MNFHAFMQKNFAKSFQFSQEPTIHFKPMTNDSGSTRNESSKHAGLRTFNCLYGENGSQFLRFRCSECGTVHHTRALKLVCVYKCKQRAAEEAKELALQAIHMEDEATNNECLSQSSVHCVVTKQIPEGTLTAPWRSTLPSDVYQRSVSPLTLSQPSAPDIGTSSTSNGRMSAELPRRSSKDSCAPGSVSPNFHLATIPSLRTSSTECLKKMPNPANCDSSTPLSSLTATDTAGCNPIRSEPSVWSANTYQNESTFVTIPTLPPSSANSSEVSSKSFYTSAPVCSPIVGEDNASTANHQEVISPPVVETITADTSPRLCLTSRATASAHISQPVLSLSVTESQEHLTKPYDARASVSSCSSTSSASGERKSKSKAPSTRRSLSTTNTRKPRATKPRTYGLACCSFVVCFVLFRKSCCAFLQVKVFQHRLLYLLQGREQHGRMLADFCVFPAAVQSVQCRN